MNKKLSKYIDHTLLRADATIEQITNLCTEAKSYDFASVCVNPCFVKLASDLLIDTDVKVCTVIGFPLGANTTKTKVVETIDAINNGAGEIDMVINISDAKMHKYQEIKQEITEIKKNCGGRILKVIIETCLLTDEEKSRVAEVAVEAKADFVKTSTGFSTSGVTVEDIKLLKKVINGRAKIKASGGIRDKQSAMEMIEAGADRIGTSAGIKIVA